MDDKVYTPTVIPDAPFPQAQQQPQTTTTPSSNGVYGNNEIPDTPLPTKTIAHEVISQSLNTKSLKILAEFQFTKSGAIQIGDATDGTHGDIRISPDGITARNVNGETTLALDGDTGDAVFKGIVEANDFVIADEIGLVSLSNFGNSTLAASFVDAIITNTSPTQVPGSSLTIELKRRANVLILANASIAAYYTGNGNSIIFQQFFIFVDGVYTNYVYVTGGVQGGVIYGNGSGQLASVSVLSLPQLSAGEHTIDLRVASDKISGTVSEGVLIDFFEIVYIVLGN